MRVLATERACSARSWEANGVFVAQLSVSSSSSPSSSSSSSESATVVDVEAREDVDVVVELAGDGACAGSSVVAGSVRGNVTDSCPSVVAMPDGGTPPLGATPVAGTPD